jgi:ATP-binding cassette subfamily F protein uup
MVSHDRTFLNNVVTSTIVFEEGGVHEYAGGYDEWRAAVARKVADKREAAKPEMDKAKNEKVKAAPEEIKKLSYKQKRELEQLPGKIEEMELAITTLHAAMAATDYYQKNADAIAAEAAQLKQLESELAEAYKRWETLDS